jgi:hypothetical protein
MASENAQIIIVNQSSAVTANQAQTIAKAINLYLTRDVAPAWGIDPKLVSVSVAAPGSSTIPDNAWPIYLVDQDPTPDALGYHEDEGSPSAYVNVGEITQYGGFILGGDGPGSPGVSSVVAHEAAEMLVDPPANLWSTMPGGVKSTPTECCDWVQAMTYPIVIDDNGSKVDVSNFIFPAGFDADAPKPYDYLGALQDPFTLAPGGYMSVQDGDGNISQINAERAPSSHVPKRQFKRETDPVGYWERRRSKPWSRASKLAKRK